MKNLNREELIYINGGSDCSDVCDRQLSKPTDTEDQIGQIIGESIGQAIGNTIRQVGQIADFLWPF